MLRDARVETIQETKNGCYLIRVIMKMGGKKWAKTTKKFSVGDRIKITLDKFSHEVINIYSANDLIIEHPPEPEEEQDYPIDHIIEDDYGAVCD